MAWTNQDKTFKRFGDLLPADTGAMLPTDNLAGTVPPITVGEATPNTVIYTQFTNENKSSSPSWTNQNQS